MSSALGEMFDHGCGGFNISCVVRFNLTVQTPSTPPSDMVPMAKTCAEG